MVRVTELLDKLPERHVRALRWFEEHESQIVPWPQPLADGTLLATKAKGIYKPEWSKYALSIRQSLTGPYPDGEVETHADGTWRWLYFQEDLQVSGRDAAFTNRGLLACYRDLVPVGVLRQTKAKPNARYQVLGLAFVDGWDAGYFVLDGIGAAEATAVRDVRTVLSGPGESLADSIARPFDPHAAGERDTQTLRAIRARQGQAGFRSQLLDIYDSRCAITRYDAEEALEAAHIVPYRGPVTNHPQNGLLLRADVHSLFDLGLLAVHEETKQLIVSSELRGTSYESYAGITLATPIVKQLQPSRVALALHREHAGL